MRQVINAIMDPEIQGHFMSSGFDFILGVNALMRAMPQPKFMRESESKEAEDIEEVVQDVEKAPTPKKKTSPKSIKIETPEDVPIPKKKPATRTGKKPVAKKSEE